MGHVGRLYYSPYYGWASLASIKKRTMKAVETPGVIDVLALDAVVAINKLPFVVQTIESCSGHITFKGRFGGNDAPCGPYLSLIYVKSPESLKLHERINELFGYSAEDDGKKKAEDKELIKAASGDVTAICVNCGETVRDCLCHEEQDYKRQLRESRQAVKIQDEISYSIGIRKATTIKDIRVFWATVEKIALDAAKGEPRDT